MRIAAQADDLAMTTVGGLSEYTFSEPKGASHEKTWDYTSDFGAALGSLWARQLQPWGIGQPRGLGQQQMG
jgi:hypothetical protein